MALDTDTLAKKMEDCLDALHVAAGKGPLPDLGKQDRGMLFTAIAQAVVEHIAASAEVEVNDPSWPKPATGTVK